MFTLDVISQRALMAGKHAWTLFRHSLNDADRKTCRLHANQKLYLAIPRRPKTSLWVCTQGRR